MRLQIPTFCHFFSYFYFFSDMSPPPPSPRRSVRDLHRISEAFVTAAVPCLTGVDAGGAPVATSARAALLNQGRRWGWNILEAPFVWAAHAAYILIAVLFGWPLFRVLLNFGITSQSHAPIVYDWTRPDFTAPEWHGYSRTFTSLYYVAGFLDAGLFIFFPAIATMLLRLVQGRPVLARIKGRRTLVIADGARVLPPSALAVLSRFSNQLTLLSSSVTQCRGCTKPWRCS